MKYFDLNDESLVMLTLAGEISAYEVLVTRYEGSVIAAAGSVLHSRYMAEDAAQDAFITAWMKLDMLSDPAKYRQWVCRIAKNCARSIASRYRTFVDLDDVDGFISADEHTSAPEYLYAVKEEKALLHKSISDLPEKVRRVIHLHYFEGLSVVEIADRLRISAGTVKAQLYDGRKRLRKELCAMNETVNDTLVQRVMKKVEELKLWQFRSSKSGFETAYDDVLSEVEKLPESADKYHALADVLLRGWWWLPGDKNDALFGRIRDAAINGKNEEVMQFVVSRETNKLHGMQLIDFIRDKQIPLLASHGFTKALGYEWFCLGEACISEKEFEKGYAAFEKAIEILSPSDSYHALSLEALTAAKLFEKKYKDKNRDKYRITSGFDELRASDGTFRHWDNRLTGKGWLRTVNRMSELLFYAASKCDGYFFRPDMKVGEVYEGSDGSRLCFEADGVCVDTPCGRFENCQKWVTKLIGQKYSTYYKDGVGIVKQELSDAYCTDVRLLKAYSVQGEGLLPLCDGNVWEYDSNYKTDIMYHSLRWRAAYADKDRAILTFTYELERFGYDESSWADMMSQIREDYFDSDKNRVQDVSFPIKRARELAKTKMEKAHTEAACSVAERIMQTDKAFNPECTATGHWNFFNRHSLVKKDGKAAYGLDSSYRWSFELKSMSDSPACYPLLYNNINDVLYTVTERVWDDSWQDGFEHTYEFLEWGKHNVKTAVKCEATDSIITAAGVFDDCLKLSLDSSGFSDGHRYFNGKKEYYFAKGIGIVKTVCYYLSDTMTAVYELTDYKDVGEGYFPATDGMMRRYDAVGLTDGYVASAKYTYVADEDGTIVIFSDRTGIKQKQAAVTEYAAIQAEVIEDDLWEAKKRDEARLRHDINNFNLMLHFLGRPSRYWAAPKKAAAWNKYRLKTVEGFSEDGEIPRAWLGFYISTCFRAACAIFGCKDEATKEEGYEYLERTFELVPKWLAIPDGELLEVGDELIFGGIRTEKHGETIVLPDGSREPLYDSWLLRENGNIVYYGLTAKNGWEWFNPVREEERFKSYIERAKKLTDTK